MDQQTRPTAYEFGDFRVDVVKRLLLLRPAGRPLPLNARTFDTLLFFLEHPGELLDKSTLMAAIWPKVVVEENNLNQHISALRRVLGERPEEHRFIVTVPGRGYRFVAAVHPVTTASAESLTAIAPDTAAAATPRERPPLAPPAAQVVDTRNIKGRTLTFIATGLVLVLITVVVTWKWTAFTSTGDGGRHVNVYRVPVRSIAVLPFRNLSSDASARMLALGISESVIHELASHNQLIVIARSSSFAFEGRNIDAREIGRELNARYLLEGSLQNQNSRLRVTAELVDTETGAHVWSMKFDRTPTDVFALQDEIAVSVGRALEQSVTVSADRRATGSGTENLEAWLVYQQGRALAGTRRLTDLDLAQQRFAEATRLDPNFALAYVARADARAVRSIFFESDTWLAMPPRFASDAERVETEQWLARAIALDPREGTVYTVRAWLTDSATAAEADYRRGLALSPNDAVGYERFAKRLYTFLEPNGRFFSAVKRDEAFEMIDRARELNPLSVTPHITKALMMMYGRGDTTEANKLLLRALELQPNYYPAIMRLAEVKYYNGETAEAIRYGEQALSLEPKAAWVRHYLVRMYLDLGDTEAARELIDQGEKRDTLLRVPIHLYQHDWATAAELAEQETDLWSPLDMAVADWAVTQRARATRDFEAGRRQLQDWTGLSWDGRENPRIEETNLDYSNYVALAEVLRWMGREDSATRLLHEVLRMLDHGSHELKRGEHMFGDTRAATLALLGDTEGALASLQGMVDGVNEGVLWYVFDLEPAFDGLRHNPRFEALRAQVRARIAVQQERLERLRENGEVPRRRAT